jgi:uncharacterized protein (TIGR02757 family)
MLKTLLDETYQQNNNFSFVEKDPISIAHKFSNKEDIEISAFLTSILSYGKRSIIISKATELMRLMDNSPHQYIMNGNFDNIVNFKHRTIQNLDIVYYMTILNEIYSEYGGLENLFHNDVKKSLISFWKIFFSLDHQKRSEKHISNIENGSAGKRLNMFLRWMVRKDNVDFGIWKNINPSDLYIPLDVHVGNVARKHGLLTRNLNDWKAVEEITQNLQKFDKVDPIKYDLALFSLDF